MVPNGKTIKSASGRKFRTDGLLQVGGQGEVYFATDVRSGEKGVLKIFSKHFDLKNTIKRIKFLLDQNLKSGCPVLNPPIDLINKHGLVGHYTPLAPGKPLEEFLENPNCSFRDGLKLALALCDALDFLHKRKIVYGDIHAGNMVINKNGVGFELNVIDLDNFSAPGMPCPPMVGQNLYLAPELRKALSEGKPAIPDMRTERFSLGVILHEIILLRHPAAGSDATKEDFERAMCSGVWLHGPAAYGSLKEDLGGYPSTVLNAGLARLFRKFISLNPDERPSPGLWQSALMEACKSVYCCTSCGGACVVDASKTVCPFCKSPYPTLALLTKSGVHIDLNSAGVDVGRDVLRGSDRVSSRHAVFRRIGPITWLESCGRNGTYRRSSSNWVRLPDKKAIRVQKGDLLKFADLEATLL